MLERIQTKVDAKEELTHGEATWLLHKLVKANDDLGDYQNALKDAFIQIHDLQEVVDRESEKHTCACCFSVKLTGKYVCDDCRSERPGIAARYERREAYIDR